MKNNHCVPPCLRKFHKLDCIFLKKIEKSQQNLVPRSKSDTEIFKLIKRAWKRKSLRHTETKTLISSYNGPLPLFIYRYAICNHNLCVYCNNIDKKKATEYCKIDGHIRNDDIYKLLGITVRNHSVSFSNSKTKLPLKKKYINSNKCVHRKAMKNKQKILKSTEEKTFEENGFEPSSASSINPQTTLVDRIKNITNIHDGSILLNDKKMEKNRSSISTVSNRNDKDSNNINDNILSNELLPMEDDISSIIKNSLKTYMSDNAAFFENNIRSTCIYESVGELEREKSKDTVLQTHDKNIFMHKDGGSKAYLESLLECADIANKKLSGSLKHKVIKQVKHVREHEIFLSEDFKNHVVKKQHYSNNHIHKKSEFNNFSGNRKNHMCSKKCFSSDTSNQNMKINKGCELGYKEISDELKSGKTIIYTEKTGIFCKKRNNEMYFTDYMNKNSASTLIKKKNNSAKNSPTTNNFIKFNLIKQMKNMKLLKSISDSCVVLGKTSKFCCLKSRKNNINFSFHNCNHGTRLMETSTNLLNNNDEISVKKVEFMKYDSTLYCNDNKIYFNHVNDRYQLKNIGKSYSHDNIKKPGMLKTFRQGKNLLDKCGDSDIVTKDNNCSKSEMSYVIYSCDGDKYTHKYEPKHVIDENQYCFVDPALYYCDSELYLDNKLSDSGQCSPKFKVRSDYQIVEHEGSTKSLNDGKEKPNLREEVFESHEGEGTMVFRKQKCSLKLVKRQKNVSRKGVVKYENIEHWIHDIKKSKSEQSIKSDNGLNQNQKKNSELSLLSDFGLNCNSYISHVSDLNGHRPHTATVTRDVAVSAVRSGEELKPSRSTIDKGIMCDDMTKNEHKHIMQLHRNNIIIESSEMIQLNGNGTSNYQSKDRELSTTITPTTEKFLKLELYQGESQTKYLEWHCNQVSNISDNSIGTSQTDFGNINNDELFGKRDKCHKSKELEELKNNFEYLCNEESNSAQSKNIWSSLKNGSQKVFSFFQPIGPLRTCFKKNIF